MTRGLWVLVAVVVWGCDEGGSSVSDADTHTSAMDASDAGDTAQAVSPRCEDDASCEAGQVCALDYFNLEYGRCEQRCELDAPACAGSRVCAPAWTQLESGLLIPEAYGVCLEPCGYVHGAPDAPDPGCPEGYACYPGEVLQTSEDVCGIAPVASVCGGDIAGVFCGPNAICGAAGGAGCEALCFVSEGDFGAEHVDCGAGEVCGDLGLGSQGYGVCQDP